MTALEFYKTTRLVASSVWKFATDFEKAVNIIQEFVFKKLPYAMIHIRRTDKIGIGEAQENPMSTYCQALKDSGAKPGKFFLMTDDDCKLL